MELSFPHKIINLPITCDTLFVTFSQYHNVLHQHCHSFEELPSLLKNYVHKYKVVIVTEDNRHTQQIVNYLKDQNNQPINSSEALSSENEIGEAHINSEDNRLKGLMNNMIKATEQKTSFLHLKNMINLTQSKINELSDKVRCSKIQINRQKSAFQSDKKRIKELKIHQKRLEKLKCEHSKLEVQINKSVLKSQNLKNIETLQYEKESESEMSNWLQLPQ